MNINNISVSFLNVISWIIFGLIVGTIANILDPRASRGGIVGAIILGISGALVGGFLASAIFGINKMFDIISFIISAIGALVMLMIYRGISREEGHIKTRITRLH